MKIRLLLLCFLAFGCKKSIPFDIEPGKVYNPSELTRQTFVKCKEQTPWEGKTVSLIGRVSPFNGFDEPSSKFVLRDKDVFDNYTTGIEIYVRNTSASEIAAIAKFVREAGPRLIGVSGQALAASMPTMGSCHKGVYIEIHTIGDLSMK